MDDFEKIKKCSGEPIEYDIKGEKFLFKPLKGKYLWKLLKLMHDLSETKTPEERVEKISNEKIDLIIELGVEMLKDVNPTVSEEVLKDFVNYNNVEVFGIINEMNYGTKEAKQEKVLTRLEELRNKNAKTGADTTGG